MIPAGRESLTGRIVAGGRGRGWWLRRWGAVLSLRPRFSGTEHGDHRARHGEKGHPQSEASGERNLHDSRKRQHEPSSLVHTATIRMPHRVPSHQQLGLTLSTLFMIDVMFTYI